MTRELMDELAGLYRELDAEIEGLGWTCRACGDCCHFAGHGHELFCSEPEAEYLVADGELPDLVTHEVCPFVDEGLCTRRQRRTLACRTYFCDAAPEDEITALTELWTHRLKRLHERFGVAWNYARLWDHLIRRKALSGKD